MAAAETLVDALVPLQAKRPPWPTLLCYHASEWPVPTLKKAWAIQIPARSPSPTS